MRLTTVPAELMPAGAVVSRVPETWMAGRLWHSIQSIGEASTCTNIRKVAAVDNVLWS
jgi:hypothetical protein